jgi:putative transposase
LAGEEVWRDERSHQALNGRTPATTTPLAGATDPAGTTPMAGTRSRAPLALHAAHGDATLTIRTNGQVKVLSCLFYVGTSRAGQQVHVIWNEQTVEVFTHDGEHLTTYPRPSTTGIYYGPRAAQEGTPMKTASQNPSAGVTGTATRTVSKGGYIGVLASKFYAGYKRRGEQVTITWDATTVTITDASRTTIATYANPPERRRWHGPTETNRPRRHETYPCSRCPETCASTIS